MSDLLHMAEGNAYLQFIQEQREKLLHSQGKTPDQPHLVVVKDERVVAHAVPNHVVIYYHGQELSPAYVHEEMYDPSENHDLRTALIHVNNGNNTATWTLFEFSVNQIEPSIPAGPLEPAIA